MSSAATLRVLSADEVQSWHDDGFLIKRRVFDRQEVETLSQEAWALAHRADLIDKHNLRCRFQMRHDNSDCLWETFDPVIDIGEVCRKFAYDPRIFDILADLYGEPAQLFKDKLIFKQPGTVGYRMHQDWIGWPGFPRSFLTVLVPIDATTEANGCTEVFPGHHHSGPLTAEDGDYHDLPPDSVDVSRGVRLILEPGDIAIFGGFTPHRSAPNLSDDWRRQLYLSYNADSDGGELRDAHYEEFRVYLRKKYAEYGMTEMYYA